MSGVTSRTLRHYDEIGLLPPAWIGDRDHRH
ncbi:MerR family DNA-binding transcriptional regulator [Sphaerisporangium viridialbum]